MHTSSRFDCAIKKFDQKNQQDPNKESQDGQPYPKELLYAQRMTNWLLKIAPEASEALQLAARSQHIGRWTISRDSYPMDRKGYLRWRTDLKMFHAKTAGEIMAECGYEELDIERVQSLIKKQRMKSDPESQTLEDVVCLVFLNFYFKDFAAKHQHEKVVQILKKTWNKMSNHGQQQVATIELDKVSNELIQKALNT